MLKRMMMAAAMASLALTGCEQGGDEAEVTPKPVETGEEIGGEMEQETRELGRDIDRETGVREGEMERTQPRGQQPGMEPGQQQQQPGQQAGQQQQPTLQQFNLMQPDAIEQQLGQMDFQQREQFVQQYRNQLTQLQQAHGQVRTQYAAQLGQDGQEKLDEIRTELVQAQAKVQELNQATQDNWENKREEAVSDLRELTDKFKSTLENIEPGAGQTGEGAQPQ